MDWFGALILIALECWLFFSIRTIFGYQKVRPKEKSPLKLSIYNSLNKSVKLVPKMFPPGMPIETGEWLNSIIAQLFEKTMKGKGPQALADTLNAEFLNLDDKGKILVLFGFIIGSHLCFWYYFRYQFTSIEKLKDQP